MHWSRKVWWSICFTVLITLWALVVAALEKIHSTGSTQAAYASLNESFFNRSFDWMFSGFGIMFGGIVLSTERRHATPTLVMGIILAFTFFLVNVAFTMFQTQILVGWQPIWPVLASDALGLLVLAICAGLS